MAVGSVSSVVLRAAFSLAASPGASAGFSAPLSFLPREVTANTSTATARTATAAKRATRPACFLAGASSAGVSAFFSKVAPSSPSTGCCAGSSAAVSAGSASVSSAASSTDSAEGSSTVCAVDSAVCSSAGVPAAVSSITGVSTAVCSSASAAAPSTGAPHSGHVCIPGSSCAPHLVQFMAFSPLSIASHFPVNCRRTGVFAHLPAILSRLERGCNRYPSDAVNACGVTRVMAS